MDDNEQNLHDFFAGLALLGLLPSAVKFGKDQSQLAAVAYKMADAMIQERKARKEVHHEGDE